MDQSIHIRSYILFSSIEIKRRSPDNDFHEKDCRIFKRSACDNVTLDFEASVQKGISDYKEKSKLFSSH